MSNDKPLYFTDANACVDYVIEEVGKEIVLGMCLGLGKPNHFANAVFKKAVEDPSIKLKIFTALSLQKPTWSTELERRFLEPLVERVWGGYIDLDYIVAVSKNKLPSNISVYEFFYKAGGFLGNAHMQQNYISTNYTHAARDVLANGMNVGAQLISKKIIDGKTQFSLSSNSDTRELFTKRHEISKAENRKILAIGQINSQMPFMYGDALVEPETFDAVLENPEFEFDLFGAPRESVNVTDYAIGLNASTIIKDGSTLQIGIGSLGDAIAYGLITREKHNEDYNAALKDLNVLNHFGDLIEKIGGTSVFNKGLYGSTEMLVDAFLHLYKNGIMRRKAYDNVPLQRLIVEDKIKEEVSPKTLSIMLEEKVINNILTESDFKFLQFYGILKDDLKFENNCIINNNEKYSADLSDKNNFNAIANKCLGDKLKNGFWMHAAFFLGPSDFYETLRNMTEEARKEINMTSVLHVNQLYANNPYSSEELKILQRQDARFINAGLMVTLFGSIVSDGLENGLVVSGVGGQFNFISQAHEVPGARCAIMIRSTRAKGKEVTSNIVYKYGHITVPRHLRDIVITEYGMADLKSKPDKDIVAALLNITDSRFQQGLLDEAKRNKKISSNYEIPERFRNNFPERIEKAMKPYQDKGLFPVFPFGTVYTDEEIVIGKALREFKEKASQSKLALIPSLSQARKLISIPEKAKPYLERMKLDKPQNKQEKTMQRIVVYALISAGVI
ncbi:MAG: hypothetical protein HQK76_01665 [Desulfobacterales bacterium]|nr:hypothetical protein [Desulfobacterales bacterium]